MNKQLLCDGVNIFHLPSTKFKTASVSLYIYRQLTKEQATMNALLTQVLRSSCAKYPTRADISKALENLYGAGMDCSVGKIGEIHILGFRFEAPLDKYTRNGNIKELSELALQIICNPLLKDGVFDSDIIRLEKENLKNQILAMINEKRTYSMERCVQEMCKDEAFGVYELGSIDDIEKITPEMLTNYYNEVINNSPIDIFVTGDVDLDEIKTLFNARFKPRNGGYPQSVLKDAPQSIREIVEEMDVSQGKLVIGCRSSIQPSSDDYYKLLVYNSVFGGGPNSKLFTNVREKHSLAYFASSMLIRQKSILLINTGIEFENFDKAKKEIMVQMDAMVNGEIDEQEIHNAKAQLVNVIKSYNDSPFSLVAYYVNQILVGRSYTIDYAVNKVMAVTKEQIVEMAKTVKLDTQYFLKNKGGN